MHTRIWTCLPNAAAALCAVLAVYPTTEAAYADHALTTAGGVHTAGDDTDCRDWETTVEVSTGTETVAGTWCAAVQDDDVDDIIVAVPGATYNRSYWDWPGDTDASFARATAAGGSTAVLTIDRLGTGDSSQPVAAGLNVSTQADAVSQVAETIKNDTAAGHLSLVGHSLGSAIAMTAAAKDEGDHIDGIGLTGFSHEINYAGVAKALTAHLHPTTVDSDVEVSDPGYLTTKPGKRAEAFYGGDLSQDDANVDEANKDVVSAVELKAGVAALKLGLAGDVTVPVMIYTGQNDQLFCGADSNCGDSAKLHESEAAHWDNVECLTTTVPKGAGHSLTAPGTDTAASGQRAVSDWHQAIVDGKCPQGPA